MISSAIGMLIRAEYEFHLTQLGFRERTGTETAILRHAASTADGFKYTAILDLKSAYDSVPREKLMQKVRHKLSSHTASMIALELQPMTIVTKGDLSATTAIVSRGMPQGASSSPPLYNVNMDSYPEKITSELGDEVHIQLFADDVKIRSKRAPYYKKP